MKRRAPEAARGARRPPEKARPPARPLLGVWPALALLAIASAILHPGALQAPFYGDDFQFLDQVRGRSLWETLATIDPLGNYFRPLSRQILFWVVAHASGESALAFHVLNWALWFAVLVALFALIRRLAGTRSAAFGTAFLALHYVGDVPLMWASDAQDLMATAAALLALTLYLGGRRGLAVVAFALALLSKETSVLTPVLAVLLDRRPGEPWRVAARRAWPLMLTALAWLVLWLAMTARRAPGAVPLQPGPLAPVAALAHLIQVVTGLEWGPEGLGRLWQPYRLALALVLAFAAVLGLWATRPPGDTRGAAPAAPGSALRAGLVWAVLGALPVSIAIRFWSAYGYLFALCGVALALGAWASTRSRGVALALLALLALGSSSARGLATVAIDYSPWTTVSHIDRFAIERGMKFNQHVISMLRKAHPTLPPNSTLFVAGLAKGTSFQTGDGPVARWAYRDSSLRSYYRSSFSIEKARRGPMYFFTIEHDTLVEVPQTADFYRNLAFGMLLSDVMPPARDALVFGLEHNPDDQTARYWLAITELQLGQRDSALAMFRSAGVTPAPGPAADVALARSRLAVRDTLAAFQALIRCTTLHGLDPESHAVLADLAFGRPETSTMGAIEALAARVLEPDDAMAWRRWARVQLAGGRYDQAEKSLERYLALGGTAAQADSDVARTMRSLKRVLPGGDLARRALSGAVGKNP